MEATQHSITPTSGVRQTGQANTAAARGSIIASDFNTFLQMLTTQARYQDPLEPIDSSEYAAQLAQFSMVEQQVKTNGSLASIAQILGASNMASLAGWVGMEARSESAAFFSGTPVTVTPRIASGADTAILVVQDAFGSEIEKVAIPTSQASYQWMGVAPSGGLYPSGAYRFSVESYSNGELISKQPSEVYGRIEEAQIENGQTVLILEGGQAVPSTEITALRKST